MAAAEFELRAVQHSAVSTCVHCTASIVSSGSMRPVQLYLMTCGPEHGLDGAGQYVGQAVKFLQGSGAKWGAEYRVRSHFYEARGAFEYQGSVALNEAIKRHPPTAWPLLAPWSWTLLGEVTDEEADEAEIAAIAHHNTHANGYNMTPGGKGRAVPHTDTARHLISQAVRRWPDQSLPTGLLKSDNGYRVIVYSADGRMSVRQFQTLQEAQAFHEDSQVGLHLGIKKCDHSLPLHIKTYRSGKKSGLCIPAMTVAGRKSPQIAFTRGMQQADFSDLVRTETLT